MIRSNQIDHTTHRKRAFRIALCIAMAANTTLAMADNGPESTAPQAANYELPAYPFPAPDSAAPISVTSNATAARPSNKQAIVKLLGITGNKPTTVNRNSSPTVAPSCNNEIKKVDVASATSMIGLPQHMAATLSGPVDLTHTTNIDVAALSTIQSEVIVANATRPTPVIPGGSDELDPSSSEENSGLDLMNSLDEISSPAVQSIPLPKTSPEASRRQSNDFKDSIRIEYAPEPDKEETGISLNMSDRAQPEQDSAARVPVLIDVRQPMALRPEKEPSPLALQAREPIAREPMGSSSAMPQRLQPMEGLTALPKPITTEKAPTSLETTVAEEVPQVSSRRDNKPEAMKIRIEGEPVPTFPQSRQSFVPMVASASGKAKLPEQVTHSAFTQPIPTQPIPIQPIQALPNSTRALPAQPSQSISKSAVGGVPSQMKSKDVSVMVKDSVSLQSSEVIQALSVEREEICQVIKTGSKAFSVIGLRPGETRVAVISEVAGQRKVEIHQVAVSAVQSSGQSSSSVASEISQTVQQLYPRSRVRINNRGTQLVVSGTVESEDTAKKILSLVRKTTLTPVIDELKIN